MPCGTALAATWDPELVEQIGALLGHETRAKGAGVLLAPTVNLHRHPLGGRNFECFSEDPFLTAEVAVAYVTGVQKTGVACAVKHFVCNDQERGRMDIDVAIDERTLRELYLLPFERLVAAGVWAVMAAYNKVGGHHCSENERLLRGVLKGEWGFDGVVVSDWFGTRSPAALGAGLDLEMPGPAVHLGAALLANGAAVDPDQLADAATRVIRLQRRTTTTDPAVLPADPRALVVRTAVAGSVLLTNDGVLPVEAMPSRLAVIGPYADRLTPQGGGSAEVTVGPTASLIELLRDRAGVEVVHEPGIQMEGAIRMIDPRLHSTSDGPGSLDVDYYPAGSTTGTPTARGTVRQTRVVWTEAPHPDLALGAFVAVMRTTFTPDSGGTWRFGVTAVGRARVLLDDEVLIDLAEPAIGSSFFGAGSPEVIGEVQLEAGVGRQLTIEYHHVDLGIPLAAVQVGAEPLLPVDAVSRAVDAAAAADVAVVIVGSDSRWESEGQDRATLHLPGAQDDLIHAVAAANDRTIVVVNCGSPVLMDWADDVAAILQLWYPGEVGAEALVAMLLGDAEPGGRLPTTFPRRREDTPTDATYPGDDVPEGTGSPMGPPVAGGLARYTEGLLMGYRGFDRAGTEPRFCFGHGLSYSSFAYGPLEVAERGAEVDVTIDVTNTGPRAAAEVVQLYVRPPRGGVDRPDQEAQGLRQDPGRVGCGRAGDPHPRRPSVRALG